MILKIVILIIVIALSVGLFVEGVNYFNSCRCDSPACKIRVRGGVFGNNDTIVIGCCYEAYVDKFDQCHTLTQNVELEINDHNHWIEMTEAK